jgi:hypothetical protein
MQHGCRDRQQRSSSGRLIEAHTKDCAVKAPTPRVKPNLRAVPRFKRSGSISLSCRAASANSRLVEYQLSSRIGACGPAIRWSNEFHPNSSNPGSTAFSAFCLAMEPGVRSNSGLVVIRLQETSVGGPDTSTNRSECGQIHGDTNGGHDGASTLRSCRRSGVRVVGADSNDGQTPNCAADRSGLWTKWVDRCRSACGCGSPGWLRHRPGSRYEGNDLSRSDRVAQPFALRRTGVVAGSETVWQPRSMVRLGTKSGLPPTDHGTDACHR